MTARQEAALLRRAAAQHGLQVTRARDGRYALHRGDPDHWEARGELAFLLRVLEPPAHSGRPSLAGGR